MEDQSRESAPAVGSVFKPTLVLMCGRTIAAIAAFLIPVLLARIFVPAQYGTYKQVFLIYATLYGLLQFGMAESLYYFLPRNPLHAGSYLLNAVIVLLGTSLTGLSLLVSFGAQIGEWMNNPGIEKYLLLLGANLAFMIASAPLEIALVSRKQYRWAAWLYASDIIRVIFFLLPILFWRDLQALLAGGLAFAVLRFAASIYYFADEFKSDFRFSGALLKKQFAYALPFQLAILVEIAQTNMHQYAVAHFFDAAVFAIYSVGCLQIPLVDFFASPAGNVMMVLMSEQHQMGRSDLVVSLWHDTTRKLALIFFPVAALLMVIARDLIPFVFTQQYRASVPIFAIWMITVTMSVFQTDAVLRVFAETRFLLLLNCIRLAIVGALLYGTLTAFGILGAVMSTVIALVAAKVIALSRIRHLFKVDVSALLPWRPLLAIAGVAIVACAGPVFIQSTAAMSVFCRLALSGLSYAFIYFGSLWWFGLLSAAEKAELLAHIPGGFVPHFGTKPSCARLSEEWKG